MNTHPNDKKIMNRRQALKTLAAVTGAVSLASLPAWEKPVIEVGALPAHAQSSMAILRVTNSDPLHNLPVSIYQMNVQSGSTVQLTDPDTLIAGPVTINSGSTYDFIVPPVAPTTTTDGLGAKTDAPVCENGYYVDVDCSGLNSAGRQLYCPAAGDVILITVSCDE